MASNRNPLIRFSCLAKFPAGNDSSAGASPTITCFIVEGCDAGSTHTNENARRAYYAGCPAARARVPRGELYWSGGSAPGESGTVVNVRNDLEV